MTSATGGYLTPTTASLEGVPFRRFLHSVLAGVTGLSGDLIRPRWQPEPSAMPPRDTDWMAFGVVDQAADYSAYVDEEGALRRQEDFGLLCSFYGPACLDNAARLRDGMDLSQNREALFLAGVAFTEAEPIRHAPELINSKWFDRADMTLRMVREVRRSYPILSLLQAPVTLESDTGLASTIHEVTP